MRVVVQRVTEATVTIDNKIKGQIGSGLLVLVGFEENDSKDDIEWLSKKVIQLRIFSDNNGLMNLSVHDIKGELLVVSQFTLHASTKKGNRPSFILAAKPEISIPLYNQFVNQLESDFGKKIQTGEFGADMKISLINDGPVTITIDTKKKE
jgi:D-aminoacyl-tRNA deacylase